jgi:Cro/C1-type HTH DNA-binding domain
MTRTQTTGFLSVNVNELERLVDELVLAGRLQRNCWKPLAKQLGIHPKQFYDRGRGLSLSLNHIQKLADTLGCKVDDLVTVNSSEPQFHGGVVQSDLWDSAKIGAFYDLCGPGSLVVVFSADGFLEYQERWLFDSIPRAVQNGMTIWYVFPDHGARESVRHFNALRQKFAFSPAGPPRWTCAL